MSQFDGRTMADTWVWQPASSSSLPFIDVNPGDWFYDAVRHVHQTGVMIGTSPTAFSPHASLTRAEITAIIFRVTHGHGPGVTPEYSDPSFYFTDVVQGGGAW